MIIDFAPTYGIQPNELNIIRDFQEALRNACMEANCHDCIFAQFCDICKMPPDEAILTILRTLGLWERDE